MYDGTMEVYDVSDWNAPQFLGSHATLGSFTHNICLSDDGKTAFTTDEVPDAYITAYDVSDVSNIMELGRIRMDPVGNEVPHNVHYLNGWLPSAYYREGVVIIDAYDPTNMVVTGYYDTHWPDVGSTAFEGVWEAYSYFPSGRIIAADRKNGLYVLQAEYVRACYLNGTVTDSATGELLLGYRSIFRAPNPARFFRRWTVPTKTVRPIRACTRLRLPNRATNPKTVNVVPDNGVITTKDMELSSAFASTEPCRVWGQVNLWPVPASSVLQVANIPAHVTEMRLRDETAKNCTYRHCHKIPASPLMFPAMRRVPTFWNSLGKNGKSGTRKIIIIHP